MSYLKEQPFMLGSEIELQLLTKMRDSFIAKPSRTEILKDALPIIAKHHLTAYAGHFGPLVIDAAKLLQVVHDRRVYPVSGDFHYYDMKSSLFYDAFEKPSVWMMLTHTTAENFPKMAEFYYQISKVAASNESREFFQNNQLVQMALAEMIKWRACTLSIPDSKSEPFRTLEQTLMEGWQGISKNTQVYTKYWPIIENYKNYYKVMHGDFGTIFVE